MACLDFPTKGNRVTVRIELLTVVLFLNILIGLICSYCRVYVKESRNPYSLTVLRDKGTFGEVQVNYFVQTISASLNDFNITGWSGPEVTLVFPNGVSEQNITIYVADDTKSEGEETLKIGLTRNTGDTKIGNPSILDVVIIANDDAYGLFSLASSSLTISEPGTGPVTEAEFEIDRSGNTFGTVIVSWEILNVSASSDLSAVRGNVTFNAGDTRKTFKVKALLDSVPEKEETFVVKLTLPGELVMYLKNGNVQLCLNTEVFRLLLSMV